jgi:hypothetical protein
MLNSIINSNISPAKLTRKQKWNFPEHSELSLLSELRRLCCMSELSWTSELIWLSELSWMSEGLQAQLSADPNLLSSVKINGSSPHDKYYPAQLAHYRKKNF